MKFNTSSLSAKLGVQASAVKFAFHRLCSRKHHAAGFFIVHFQPLGVYFPRGILFLARAIATANKHRRRQENYGHLDLRRTVWQRTRALLQNCYCAGKVWNQWFGLWLLSRKSSHSRSFHWTRNRWNWALVAVASTLPRSGVSPTRLRKNQHHYRLRTGQWDTDFSQLLM